jgi:hypothetical protein
MAGAREQGRTSPSGGIAPRWVLIDAEHRRPRAQRTVDTPLLRQRPAAVNAFQPRCRPALAGDAEAPPALHACAPDWQAPQRQRVTIRPTPRSATRGRPSPATPPAQVRSPIAGALAASMAARAALVAQHRCGLLAPQAPEDRPLSPPERLAGDPGQKPAERGFRWLNEPRFLASALDRTQPPRSMALWRVMTGCVWVSAALESRRRTGLNAPQPTVPTHQGQPIQQPTARWVCPSCVGSHLLLRPGEWPLVLKLTATHPHLLRLLGPADEAVYSSRGEGQCGMSALYNACTIGHWWQT